MIGSEDAFMNVELLQHPLVKAAITAMNSQDRAAWMQLFAENTVLTDDGNRQDFVHWSDHEIFGKDTGELRTVDRQEDGGLTVYGKFRSSRWGEFNTFFRFHVQDGKIIRLDVGQA